MLSTYQIKHGDLEAAFAASDLVLEASFRTAFLEHAYLERESLLGYIDEEGRVTVVGGSHQPHNQRRFIAEVLKLPLDRVRVITPPTGGSFGGKQDPWPFTAVGLAVYHLRQPVLLVYSRGEFDAGLPQAPPLPGGLPDRRDPNRRAHGRPGAHRLQHGRLRQWRALHSQLCRHGSRRALPLAGGRRPGPQRLHQRPEGRPVSRLRHGTVHLCFGVRPGRIDRKAGPGSPRISPAQLPPPAEETFLGYSLPDDLGYRQVLEAIQPHFNQFAEEADAYNQTHAKELLRRGVGLSGMWYRFGKSGGLKIEAHAELAQDGHFIVYCSAPDYGQGTNTTMSQIAAAALGVSRERVEIVNADTARVPNSDVQGASRATFFVGGAVKKVAETLVQAIFGVAAELLDTRQPARTGRSPVHLA